MIDPNAINTIRVGQLVEAVFSGTDNIPHEVGTDLRRGTIADLATYVAGVIESTGGLAFLPISVTDGQELPPTTANEWFLAGKGTYTQTGGYPDIICVEGLNVIIGNGVNWSLGVGVPIIVDPPAAMISQTVTEGVTNYSPSEDAVYTHSLGKENISNKVSEIINYSEVLYPNEKATHNALDLKLNISDLPTNLTLYPTNVASDVVDYVKLVTDIHDTDYNTVAVDISTPTITTTDQLVASLISDAGVLIGQPGVFNATTFGNIRRLSGTGTATFYFKVFHRNLAGTETLIGTSSNTDVVTSSSYLEFTAALLWDDGTFIDTDRIVIKYYANRIAGNSDPVYQFQFGGSTPVRTLLPVPFSVVDAGYELKTNKQNSLTVDGTGVKYPTVDAVNGGLLKYNTAIYDRGASTKPVTAKKYGILVAGQSNADGRVPQINAPAWLNQADPTILGVKMFNRNTGLFSDFKLGANTGADNNTDTRWAFDMQTYHLLHDYLSDDIYVIKRTKGGTPISTLAPTNGGFWEAKFELINTTPKLLQDLENQYMLAKKLNPDFEIRAFLWHQGESDSGNAAAILDYYQNFKNVISYVRGFTENPTLPIIFGTISHASAQYNSVIEAAQLRIASEDFFAHVVDMGAGTLLDAYHFDATSSEFLGTSVFNIIKDYNNYAVKNIPTNDGDVIHKTGDETKTGVLTLVSDAIINGMKIGRGFGSISGNTVLGNNSGGAFTTGSLNTFTGYNTGMNDTTGSQNTFTGFNSGVVNTTGASNTFMGTNTGLANTIGSGNSFIGTGSGQNNISGGNNAAIGQNSARYIADKTTAVSVLNNSVMLGYRTSPLANTQTNQTVIGYDATGLGSNTTVIGNSSTIQTWLGGRLTVGSTVDDGSSAFQLTGIAKLNTTPTTSAGTYDILARNTSTGVVEKVLSNTIATTASPTFTGTPTAPTAILGTNTTQIATTAFVQGIRPYKVYTAMLTQTSTSAPTAKVLENTLGGTLVWTYSSIGVYVGTLTGAFTVDKSPIILTSNNSGVTLTGGASGSTNFVGIETRTGGTLTDGLMTDSFIEIRVYN